jgi:hypothetical protein
MEIQASELEINSSSLLQMGHASLLHPPRGGSTEAAVFGDESKGLATITFTGRDPSNLCSSDMENSKPLPTRTSCPSECPFSHPIHEDPCHKVCVSSDGCPTYGIARGFPDARFQECVALCGKEKEDFIVGCTRCAGVGICETCAVGYHLSANQQHCLHHMNGFWYFVYAGILVIVLILVMYLVKLSNRPTINTHGLSRALLHRHRRKVWRERREDRTWHPYSMYETAVHSDDISGQGIWLYFSTLYFAMAVAFVLFIGNFLAYSISDVKSLTEEFKLNCDIGEEMEAVAGTQTANDPTGMLRAYESYGILMFCCLVGVYVVIFVASMWFMRHQVNASNRWDETNCTHEDYAVHVCGIPGDVTDPSILKDFFQKALDDELAAVSNAEQVSGLSVVSQLPSEERASFATDHEIIGVSIAYDYKEHQALIEDAIQDWVEELEEEIKRRKDSNSSSSKSPVATPRNASAEGCAQDKRSLASRIANLSCLDHLFMGSDVGSTKDSIKQRAEKLKEILGELHGSGHAYIISSTPVVQEVLLAIFARNNAPTFKDSKLHVQDVWSEPPSIYWENFTDMKFWFRIFLGVLVTLATIGLWITLYMPYALSYITFVQIPGERPSMYQDTLLGLLISAGNAIVAKVVDIVTQWAGFCQKDRRDIAILSLAFLATLLNTGADIWIASEIAKGTALSDALEGQINSFDRAISRELMGVIVPGYILLPYLIAPFFEHVVPYYLGKWFVQSKRMSLRASEEILVCPEFDICWRYSDTLNNFTICLAMLLFATPYSYMVMCWLLAYLVLIYSIDKWKLLRYTSQTFYTTRRLNDAALFWWVVPTGVLAGIMVSWGCRCRLLPQHRTAEFVAIGVVAHIALYFLCGFFVRSLARPAQTEMTPYSEMCDKLRAEGKVWSYFNTNPVYCLRSKHLGIKEPGARHFPSIPYIPGKQWLQPDAPHCFALHELELTEELSEELKIVSESSRKLIQTLSMSYSAEADD